jgi:hypothetical protein
MAKGNIILGYLRGSIGDITFFRAKGQQLSRARNRAPANPRTVGQMDQRAKMACAVKFFSQVGANFFKYAFEGKKDKESYFNAFVKNNIYLGGYIGKQASRVFDFPALGAWQISAGTLPEITAPFPQTVKGVAFSVGTVSGTPINTISGLSSALIGSDSSRWREGDILTCLCYCATNYATLPTVYTDQGNRAYTALWQIRLSTSNTDTLPSIEFPLLGMTFNCFLDEDGLIFEGSSGSEYSNNLYCFGLVHSRNTASGLKVSSSTLVAPQAPELLAVVSSQSGNYYNAVIADWQASEEAILQGGLSSSLAEQSAIPFMNCGFYFQGAQSESEIMTGQQKNIPSIQNVTWDLGDRDTSTNAFWLNIGGAQNPGYDVTQIDATKINFVNLPGARYNSQGSSYASFLTQLKFDITAISTKPTMPVYVYYDDKLFLTIYFL